MVFCYECDTLYPDLNDLGNHAREPVNSCNSHQPVFACPHCGYMFEYYFMQNPLYWVPKAKWLAAGYGPLLKTT